MQYRTFGDQVAHTTRRVVKVILVSVVILAIAFLCLSYWGVYDEGVRAGTVLRISKKGMIFKTYEGQLNVQTFGAIKGANPIMEAFDFSVSASTSDAYFVMYGNFTCASFSLKRTNGGKVIVPRARPL